MEKLVKKFLLLNAELLSIGAEKVKYLADDFIRSEIQTNSESKKFVNKVEDKLAMGEKELEERVKRIARATKDLLSELGIAPKEDSQNLEEQIRNLEGQLKTLRSQKETGAKDNQEAGSSKKETVHSK